MSIDPIPQVRIVRHAGQIMAPPPAPRTDDSGPGYFRTAMIYAVGLWPLTAVVLLMAGFVVLTAHFGAP